MTAKRTEKARLLFHKMPTQEFLEKKKKSQNFVIIYYVFEAMLQTQHSQQSEVVSAK